MTLLAQVLYDVAMYAIGLMLVLTEHYGWAWIPFFLACTTTVKTLK